MKEKSDVFLLRAVLILLVSTASRQIEVKAFRANSCSFNLSERSHAERVLSLLKHYTVCVCVCVAVCVCGGVNGDRLR